MYDLTTIQLHQRVADMQRMRTRLHDADTATPAPTRRIDVRIAVARLLMALATWIAPPHSEQRTV